MTPKKFRLVTRSDFDGLVCAVLLKKLDMIDDILFVHPKDVEDGKINITETDITTNVPYDPNCHMAFDHHESESIRYGDKVPDNFVLDPTADSAARVVYRHFGGREAAHRQTLVPVQLDTPPGLVDDARPRQERHGIPFSRRSNCRGSRPGSGVAGGPRRPGRLRCSTRRGS